MKKLSIYLAALAFIAACNNGPKADKAETTDKQTVASTEGTAYTVDTATSVITWTGTKPAGSHTGVFKLKEGSFLVKENMLTGGNFIIDINSLAVKDLDAENTAKLEGHLKSPDFFNVSKYPNAKFEITSVEPFVADSTTKNVIMKDATHIIKGNLTLKDSTKNISFPARITVDTRTLAATADFNIDRTMWGMNYKGPGNPQDWFINKQVNLKLSLNATKK